MNKKDYIDAINEIEVSNELKNKTLEKIKEKRKYKRIYAISTAMIILVLAISIAIPINYNKNKVTPIEIVEENNGLPKIESFENLYNILNKNTDENYKAKQEELILEDSIDSTQNESIQSNNSKEEQYNDYSNTNVQVQGVDEADIVKTDGEYIYYLSLNKVVIVNSSDSKNLKVTSEIKFEEKNFYPNELFIAENKLIVIGTTGIYNKYFTVDMAYPTDTQEFTIAKVYNIENKNIPKLEREIQIEGSYISSRMIQDNIYVISNKYLYTYLFRNNKLENLNEEEYKPKYKDTAVGEEMKSIDYQDIYYFPESDDTSYLNIAVFSVNNNEPANIESYLGAGEQVYSSQNNLYITKTKYEYKDSKTSGYYDNYDVNTYIYKFALDKTNVIYKNVGSVPGEVLNQFSMDEKDGCFRIATTDRDNWNDETSKNNLYILNENLEKVGEIENLAKGEKIYSVRFMGNRAYMVTFKETDPLFVIDLSNVTTPKVLGELKIPGYSNYLHPYDDTHIIGFGENTKVDEYGNTISDGMKMALFDVSDPNNPQELYSVNIGGSGTYSEILYNHKALLFSKEKNLIAFPISISEDGESYHSKLRFQGTIVYELSLDKGFNLKGKIAHMQVKNGYEDYDYTKEVERIIYINDSLYTLSKSLIKSTNMNTMEEEDFVEIKTED